MAQRGVYRQLIESQQVTNLQQLRAQRVALIKRIQELRNRPLVSYVTTMNPLPRVTAYIIHEDIVPFSEVLDSVEGDSVDVLLESPGGLSEVAVELASLLRNRFKHVGFIIPHAAMSAATMLVMSGDEILMDHRSSLGPIDPQFVGADGRLQPAQAIVTGLETIKKAVEENKGVLNPAYIPILRNIDPGKLQNALDASELSERIVRGYLVKHKFSAWKKHSSTGREVTPEEREARAAKVAKDLCNHKEWLSHSHPIKIAELRKMRVLIDDYGNHAAKAMNKELQDAIWTLWVHYHHFLSSTNTYKTYESESVEFYKIAVPVAENVVMQPIGPMPIGPQPLGMPVQQLVGGHALINVACNKCGTPYKLQANFGMPQKLEPGSQLFPSSCSLTCKGCGTIIDLTGLRMQIEARVHTNLIFEALP